MHIGVATVLLLLTTALAGPVQQQTGEEIIARSIEARGGVGALEARQTVKMTAEVVRPLDGIKYRMTLYRKRPTYYRVEFENADGRMVRATDGQSSWWINPFADVLEPAPMPAELAAGLVRQAHIDTSLAGFLPAGSSATFLDRVEVEGIDYLRVLIERADGSEIINYYDANTYLVGRTLRTVVDESGEHEVVTLMSDYREVEGVVYSYKSENLVDGQTVQITTWTSFEPNVQMDDSLFRMPG